MYDYNKINERQRLKSKKQIQHGVKIGSSLLHTFMTSSKPNYLPKAHLSVSSRWALGLQHINLRGVGEHKHLVCNSV